MLFSMAQEPQGDTPLLRRTSSASALLRTSRILALMWPMRRGHWSALASTCSAKSSPPSSVLHAQRSRRSLTRCSGMVKSLASIDYSSRVKMAVAPYSIALGTGKRSHPMLGTPPQPVALIAAYSRSGR